jgi:hypothetical protein
MAHLVGHVGGALDPVDGGVEVVGAEDGGDEAVGGAALVGHPDQVAELDAGVGDHVLVVGDLPGELEQAGVGAVEALAHGRQLVLHVGEGLLGGEELR